MPRKIEFWPRRFQPERQEDPITNWRRLFRQFIQLAQPVFAITPKQEEELWDVQFLIDQQHILRQWIDLLRQPAHCQALLTFFQPTSQGKYYLSERNQDGSFFLSIAEAVDVFVHTSQSEVYQTALHGPYQQTVTQLLADVSHYDLSQRPKILHLALTYICQPEILGLIHADHQHQLGTSRRLESWSSIFADAAAITAYLTHPQRPQLETVPPLDRSRLLLTKFDRQQIAPAFWLAHPQLFKLVAQISASVPQPKTLGWGDRRLIFQLLMGSLGRHGVTDQEISELVLELWQPDPRQYLLRPDNYVTAPTWSAEDEFYYFYIESGAELEPAARKTVAFASLTLSSQRQLISMLRNGVLGSTTTEQSTVNHPRLQQLRRQVRAQKGFPETLAAKSLAPESERTNWRESSYHPLYRYLPLVGQEVECNYPLELSEFPSAKSLYRLVGHFAYRNGADQPVEIAADPTIRHETNQAIIDDLVNCNLLDLHAETTQSLHVNVELLGKVHLAMMIRLLFLCGQGTHPQPGGAGELFNLKSTQHSLVMNAKMSESDMTVPPGRNRYIEVKGLRVTTATELKEIQRRLSLFGAAARSYELILRQVKHLQLSETGLQELAVAPVLLSRAEISRYPDVTHRQLALIWLDFLEEAPRLSQALGLETHTYWRQSVPTKLNSRVGKLVHQVFPTPQDHDDDRRITRSYPGFSRVRFAGQFFPNQLAAARHFAEQYLFRIHQALAGQLAQTRKAIAWADQAWNEQQQAERREAVLSTYCGVRIGTHTADQIDQLYRQLRYQLIEHPDLAAGDFNLPS